MQKKLYEGQVANITLILKEYSLSYINSLSKISEHLLLGRTVKIDNTTIAVDFGPRKL